MEGSFGLNLLFAPDTIDSDEEDVGKDDIQDQAEAQSYPNALKVENVNLNFTKNSLAHHTDEYIDEDFKGCVYRRGQQFDIDITFSKACDPKKDGLKLVFTFPLNKKTVTGAKKDDFSKELILSNKVEEGKWGAKELSNKGKTITVRVSTPPTIYIGRWELKIDFPKNDKKEKKAFEHTCSEPIYIIFNPWCPADQVYMDNNEQLEEYVMNGTGKVFRAGRYDRINNRPRASGKPWNFGQFEPPVLKHMVEMLQNPDITKLRLCDRGDPVMISRRLSALGNTCNPNGILAGNWSGKYEGGKSPTAWCGSLEIMKEHHKTNQPVNYGQCWVFSGLLTTMCRSLGIPCKSVTNFASAHDTDCNMTIDRYIDQYGRRVKYMSSDSVWNFHVWNEVWMKRPDLGSDYNGWQALDATPQEESSGMFQCGPASIKAIKEGNVLFPYDAGFIFAEVNADIVEHHEDESGEFKKTKIKPKSVGTRIVTYKPEFKQKHVFDDTDDVAEDYKYPEGSALERVSVCHANKMGPGTEYVMEDIKEDVKFEFTITNIEKKEDIVYGQDLVVTCKATNTSKEKRTIGGWIKTNSCRYVGQKQSKIKREEFTKREVEKGKSTTFDMNVSFDNYYTKMGELCMIRSSYGFVVIETGQLFNGEDEDALEKPDLKITAPKSATIQKPFDITVSFKNPLPIELTDWEITIDGPAMKEALKVKKQDGDMEKVLKGEEFKKKIELKLKKGGKRNIVVSFNSPQIENVDGTFEMIVAKE